MTRTSQLQAHYAAVQVDAVLDNVVRSYIPTLELLVDEFHEQSHARRFDPYYSEQEHRRRLAGLFARYRAAVVELGDVLGDIRRGIGVDRGELPAGESVTLHKLDRLRRAAQRHRSPADSGVPL